MEKSSAVSIWVPVLVAVITGLLAGIPAVLNYVATPKVVEGELAKIQKQSESQLRLQRDQEIARIMTDLSSADEHLRAGAALSLAVLGGDEVIPILIGKLRESAIEMAILEQTAPTDAETPELRRERRFIIALKQALLTKGMDALKPLVELNRDLKFTRARMYRSRKVQEGEEGYKEDVAIQTRALDEVKDAMASILVAVASLEGPDDERTSPIAEAGISLAEIDLAYMVLWRINFSGVDLSGADLSNNRLGGTSFAGAKLHGAKFDEAGMGSSDFSNADLSRASLKKVFGYQSSTFAGANVQSARIDDSKLVEHLKSQNALNCCR